MFYLFLFKQKRIKNILKKEKEIYLGDIIINLNKIKNKNLKILNQNLNVMDTWLSSSFWS